MDERKRIRTKMALTSIQSGSKDGVPLLETQSPLGRNHIAQGSLTTRVEIMRPEEVLAKRMQSFEKNMTKRRQVLQLEVGKLIKDETTVLKRKYHRKHLSQPAVQTFREFYDVVHTLRSPKEPQGSETARSHQSPKNLANSQRRISQSLTPDYDKKDDQRSTAKKDIGGGSSAFKAFSSVFQIKTTSPFAIVEQFREKEKELRDKIKRDFKNPYDRVKTLFSGSPGRDDGTPENVMERNVSRRNSINTRMEVEPYETHNIVKKQRVDQNPMNSRSQSAGVSATTSRRNSLHKDGSETNNQIHQTRRESIRVSECLRVDASRRGSRFITHDDHGEHDSRHRSFHPRKEDEDDNIFLTGGNVASHQLAYHHLLAGSEYGLGPPRNSYDRIASQTPADIKFHIREERLRLAFERREEMKEINRAKNEKLMMKNRIQREKINTVKRLQHHASEQIKKNLIHFQNQRDHVFFALDSYRRSRYHDAKAKKKLDDYLGKTP
eukprot:TRINITY_DN1347_c0_g1_i2.p1 TRINITY_DN1347_c0_g1~~TRINITY_DN1347_c0_g1_i2.p1  ORF type:complete len:494 (-),score=49.02 TRINITY_DN1347_c0_g1_i2:219-1700(-)